MGEAMPFSDDYSRHLLDRSNFKPGDVVGYIRDDGTLRVCVVVDPDQYPNTFYKPTGTPIGRNNVWGFFTNLDTLDKWDDAPKHVEPARCTLADQETADKVWTAYAVHVLTSD